VVDVRLAALKSSLNLSGVGQKHPQTLLGFLGTGHKSGYMFKNATNGFNSSVGAGRECHKISSAMPYMFWVLSV
jgi:hypothetical protein